MDETKRLETLEALDRARRRYVAVLETCAALVEQQASQGDPLAKYVISELDAAATAMKSENVAGHAFLAEASI